MGSCDQRLLPTGRRAGKAFLSMDVEVASCAFLFCTLRCDEEKSYISRFGAASHPSLPPVTGVSERLPRVVVRPAWGLSAGLQGAPTLSQTEGKGRKNGDKPFKRRRTNTLAEATLPRCSITQTFDCFSLVAAFGCVDNSPPPFSFTVEGRLRWWENWKQSHPPWKWVSPVQWCVCWLWKWHRGGQRS